MVFSHHVRYGIWGLVSLLLVGLVWLGVNQYLADSRALAAVTPAPVAAPPTLAPQASAVPLAAEKEPAKPPVELVVHVAGAVAKPGVYRLPEGARVADAITAAGGEKADAALDSLNLAEPIGDGQKVTVLTKAEVQAGVTPPATAPQPVRPVTTQAPAASSGAKLKLNQATEAQLKALGLTPMAAKSIVEHTRKNGPLRTWEQVDAVPQVGEKTLEILKSQTQL